jgi:hypothetical protein
MPTYRHVQVPVRDPYAPDMEYENDKPPSLTEPDPERNAPVSSFLLVQPIIVLTSRSRSLRQLDLKVDHRSDVSFVSGDKDILDVHRDRDSDL